MYDRVKRAIAATRHLALVGVVFGIGAAATAFGWGAYRTVVLVGRLVHGEVEGMAFGLVQLMDSFLIGAGLLIFALGLQELFVGELALPAWLVIRDLDELKAKLAGIVTMVMAVSFLERLEMS